MAGECTQYPLDIESAYNYAEGRFGFIQNEINWLFNNRTQIGNLTWSQHLKTYMNNVNIVQQSLVYGSTSFNTPYRVPYVISNCMGGTIDMDDILNAMLAADFDELQKFIGIEDAYRLAIWNAPFNAEWYASLARGFQKWP